jgi:hypothetical protein
MAKSASESMESKIEGLSRVQKRLKPSPNSISVSTTNRTAGSNNIKPIHTDASVVVIDTQQESKDTSSAMLAAVPPSVSSSAVASLLQPSCCHYSKNFTLPIDDKYTLSHILSFVGENSYLFVGSVNRTFEKVYTTLFPEKETRPIAPSLAMLQFCWDAITHDGHRYGDKYSHYIDFARQDLWYSAVEYGNTAVVKYFLDVILLSPLAQKKEKWLNGEASSYSEGFHSTLRHLGSWAAKYGHLELLQLACQRHIGLDWRDSVCRYAFQNGHMHVLHWALQNGFEWDGYGCEDSVIEATKNGKLEALKWLQEEKGFDMSVFWNDDDDYNDDVHEDEDACADDTALQLCDYAGRNGHINVVEWLYSIGSPPLSKREDNVYVTCARGHLEAVRYMVDSGCNLGDKSCHYAALSGSVPLLQYLRSLGCKWDDLVPAYAASKGRINLIEWAVNNGCPWSESAIHHATTYGQLDTFKWLVSNGCPWSGKAISYINNNVIYRWAVANGWPAANDYEIFDGPILCDLKLIHDND